MLKQRTFWRKKILFGLENYNFPLNYLYFHTKCTKFSYKTMFLNSFVRNEYTYWLSKLLLIMPYRYLFWERPLNWDTFSFFNFGVYETLLQQLDHGSALFEGKRFFETFFLALKYITVYIHTWLYKVFLVVLNKAFWIYRPCCAFFEGKDFYETFLLALKCIPFTFIQ